MLKSNDSINNKALSEKGAGKAQSESAHLPPLWPGFESRTCLHMWVEFVVGSRLCSAGFSPGPPVFFPSQRPFFQIPTRRKNSGQEPPLSGVSTDEFTYHMRQRLASCVYYEEGGLQSEGLAAKEDKASTLTRVSSLARVSSLKRVSPLAIVSCS